MKIHLLVCSLSSGGGDGGDEHNRKKTDGFQTPRGRLQVQDNSFYGTTFTRNVVCKNLLDLQPVCLSFVDDLFLFSGSASSFLQF